MTNSSNSASCPADNTIKVAINGFGRIGRSVFRQCCEQELIEVVAINDVQLNSKEIEYLSSFDSVYGRSNHEMHVTSPEAICFIVATFSLKGDFSSSSRHKFLPIFF